MVSLFLPKLILYNYILINTYDRIILPVVPLGTPVNITAIAVNSTAIQLSWSEVPAIKQNGIITQYEVVFAPLETFGEQIAAASMNITDASILFIILDSLQEYVQYSSTIRAYTNVGKGPFSTATIIQTPEDGK